MSAGQAPLSGLDSEFSAFERLETGTLLGASLDLGTSTNEMELVGTPADSKVGADFIAGGADHYVFSSTVLTNNAILLRGV